MYEEREKERKSANPSFQIIRVAVYFVNMYMHRTISRHAQDAILLLISADSSFPFLSEETSRPSWTNSKGKRNWQKFRFRNLPPILSHTVWPPLNYFRWFRPTHDQSNDSHIYTDKVRYYFCIWPIAAGDISLIPLYAIHRFIISIQMISIRLLSL